MSLIGLGVGAAFGAYNEDITDHPMAGLMGATIGGTAGYLMDYTMPNFKKSSAIVTGLKIDNSRIDTINQEYFTNNPQTKLINRFTDMTGPQSLSKRFSYFDEQREFGPTRPPFSLITQPLIRSYGGGDSFNYGNGYNTSVINTRNHITSNMGIKNNSIGGINEFLNGLTGDNRTINRVTQLLDNPNSDFINHDILEGMLPTIQKQNLILKAEDEKVDAMFNYFHQNLGNPVDIAKQKASMFDRLAKENSMITVTDGTIHFTDAANGRNVTVPLTSHLSDGAGGTVRYHQTGNGTISSVKGASHLAEEYRKPGSKVTSDELLRGYDPELLLEHIDASKGILPQHETMVGSYANYEADANDAEHTLSNELLDHTQLSESFKRRSNSTEIKHTLDKDYEGNPYFRQVQTTASQVGQKAEIREIYDNLRRDLPPEQLTNTIMGSSMNSFTTLNTSPLDKLNPYSPESRNSSGVGVRGYSYVPQNNEMKDLIETMGSNAQFENSNMYETLHIGNEESFNHLMTGLLGNNKTLADGSGFFGEESSNRFAVFQNVNETIQKDKLGNFLVEHPQLKEFLESSNEKLDYNIPLKPGEAIGHNPNGMAVELHNMYTDGHIHSVGLDLEGNLKLGIRARFNPEDEGLVKLYGEATKADYRRNSAAEHGLMSVIGESLNSGDLTQEDNMVRLNEAAARKLGIHDDIHYELSEDADFIRRRNSAFGKDIPQEVFESIDTPGTYEMNIKKFNSMMAQQMLHKKSRERLENYGRNYDIITSADNTGSDKIQKLLELGNSSETLVAEDFRKTGLLSEASIGSILQHANSLPDSLTQQSRNRIATLSGLMTSTHKMTTDLSATVHSDIMDNLHRLMNSRRYWDTRDAVRGKIIDLPNGALSRDMIPEYELPEELEGLSQDLRHSFNTAFRNPSGMVTQDIRDTRSQLLGLVDYDNLLQGRFRTVASSNLGMAKVGAGNNAGMSWIARNNLMKSGFSGEDLKVFGQQDQNLLLDLDALLQDSKVQKASVNEAIAGRQGDFKQILSMAPEARAEKFSNAFGSKIDTSHIAYNLENPVKGISSLNFSRVTTNHTGSYDDGIFVARKELEKLRHSIYEKDQMVSRITDPRDKQKAMNELNMVAQEYLYKRRSMFASGDSNLLKAASTLRTNSSMISIAEAVGGNAASLVAERGGVGGMAFISESGMKRRLKQMGVTDYKLEEIQGKSGLYRVMYGDNRDIPLASMVTREPAQGSLSSQYMDLIVDESITSRRTSTSVFFATTDKSYKYFMFGDHDQDTIQELFPKLQSKDQYNKFMDIHNRIRDSARSFLKDDGNLSFIEAMQVKGTGKAKMFKSEADFLASGDNAFSNFAEYQVAEGEKGRMRKSLAGMSTTFSMALSESLGMQYKTTDPALTEARFATHQLVENILKSSHKDTEALALEIQSPLNEMAIARKNYFGIGNNTVEISQESYRSTLQKNMRLFLNHDKMEEVHAKKLDTIINNIIDADLKHGHATKDMALLVTDVNAARFGEDAMPSLEQFMKNSGQMEANYSSDMFESTMKRTKGTYQEISRSLINTYKNNKKLLIGSGLALAGTALMTRDAPNFENGPPQHSSKLLQKQANGFDGPNAIDTNRQGAGYIRPESQTNSKNVVIQGDFVYNEDNSPAQRSQNNYNMSKAIFGDGIRTARLENN